MSEIDLRERLCSRYCPYYKPSKKEELACNGFLIIQRFITEGKEIPFIKAGKILDAATEKILREHLCTSCPFYESDCDFAQHEDGTPPCGGFSLLGILIEADVLTVDNMKAIRSM
jgi:hypothetical protein